MRLCACDRVWLQLQLFVVAAAAAAAATAPALRFTHPSFARVEAGSSVKVSFAGASGPVGLALQRARADAAGSDADAYVIAGHVGASFLTWSPPPTLSGDEYVLVLEDETSGATVRSNVFAIVDRAAAAHPAPVETPHMSSELKPRGPSHPHISTSAKILVGVGSALIVLLVIGGCFLYFKCCHRKERVHGRVRSRAGAAGTEHPLAADAGAPPYMVEAPSKVHVRAKGRSEVG